MSRLLTIAIAGVLFLALVSGSCLAGPGKPPPPGGGFPGKPFPGPGMFPGKPFPGPGMFPGKPFPGPGMFPGKPFPGPLLPFPGPPLPLPPKPFPPPPPFIPGPVIIPSTPIFVTPSAPATEIYVVPSDPIISNSSPSVLTTPAQTLQPTQGLKIATLYQGTAAQQGLKQNDIIIAANNTLTPTMEEFRAVVARSGASVVVTFISGQTGQMQSVTLYPQEGMVGVGCIEVPLVKKG